MVSSTTTLSYYLCSVDPKSLSLTAMDIGSGHVWLLALHLSPPPNLLSFLIVLPNPFSPLDYKLLFLFYFIFFLFRAYGSSQARGLIGATAVGLCHSHSKARSELVCDLYCSSQHQILNPLSEARDRNPQPHGSSLDSFSLCHDWNPSLSFLNAELHLFTTVFLFPSISIIIGF